jgi:hypothetical protein
MASQFNSREGREMETLTRDECMALATAAGCPERMEKFFSNGQTYAWAEYVREAIARPKRANRRPETVAEKYGLTMLGTGDDLKN